MLFTSNLWEAELRTVPVCTAAGVDPPTWWSSTATAIAFDEAA